ncbi:MAG: hypothetical protein SOR84_02330 [Candidatus Cryptobacteroides sp.]|nr:hypothetical protein [Candidatus Cryptobacteroides sp.]
MSNIGRKIIVVVLMLASMMLVSPQSSSQTHGKGGWQDKMKAERVAYLTDVMGITSSEAEKFWPVYNEMAAERKSSFEKAMRSFKTLNDAVKAGKPEAEISVLLNNYLKANAASRAVELKYVPRFNKILSVEKVAKLFVGEEEFRRQQIHRWKENCPKP